MHGTRLAVLEHLPAVALLQLQLAFGIDHAVLGEMLDAWLVGTGLAELADYETRIAEVSTADVHALALRYFDPERRVEGIIRGVGRTV